LTFTGPKPKEKLHFCAWEISKWLNIDINMFVMLCCVWIWKNWWGFFGFCSKQKKYIYIYIYIVFVCVGLNNDDEKIYSSELDKDEESGRVV
jgi:hypothetical protein